MSFKVATIENVIPSSLNKLAVPGLENPQGTYSFDWEEAFLSLLQRVYDGPEFIPRGNYWRTIIACKDSKFKKYSKDGKKYYEWIEILAQDAKATEFLKRHVTEMVDLAKASTVDMLEATDHIQAMNMACEKHRFFLTSNGAMGLGLSKILPNELIRIVYPWQYSIRHQAKFETEFTACL